MWHLKWSGFSLIRHKNSDFYRDKTRCANCFLIKQTFLAIKGHSLRCLHDLTRCQDLKRNWCKIGSVNTLTECVYVSLRALWVCVSPILSVLSSLKETVDVPLPPLLVVTMISPLSSFAGPTRHTILLADIHSAVSKQLWPQIDRPMVCEMDNEKEVKWPILPQFMMSIWINLSVQAHLKKSYYI